MKIITTACFLFFLCLTATIQAQPVEIATELVGQPALVDSKEALEKGVEMHEKGNYAKALEYFAQVQEGDTNNVNAVYETVNTLLADSQYVKAKQLALKGIRIQDANRRRFLLSLGNAYDYLKMPDSALTIYDSIMRLYPQDHQPYYEKGVSYYSRKKYDSAEYYFQHAVLMNPFHFRSNYMLGLTYLVEGRLSEAFIALECSLLVTSNIEFARKSIGMLILICDETDEINNYFSNREVKYNNPIFEETDQIINVKLAMNSDYKLKSSLDDKTFRETQMLMEKLSYNAADSGFAMQYYIPLLSKLYKDDMFEPFMMAIFSGYHIEEVDKIQEKYRKRTAEVKKISTDYLENIRSTHVLHYLERQKTREKYHFISKDNIFVVGYFKDVANGIFDQGPVTIYEYENLLATGAYNNFNQRQGEWKMYYANGNLKKLRTFKDDVEIGEAIDYYDNGNIYKKTQHDEKGMVTKEESYTYRGFLDNAEIQTSADEKEYLSYYMNGALERKVAFLKGHAKDGVYNIYYDNGAVKKTIHYANETQNGPYIEYYENGKIREESFYIKGVRDSTHTYFYENGKPHKRFHYSNGKTTGEYEEYYEDGTLFQDGHQTRDFNKINTRSYYDEQGKRYGTLEYRNDTLINVVFNNKDGKIIYQEHATLGLHAYETYFPNGNKKAILQLNKEGKLEGKQTYYYETGAKKEESMYADDDLDGPSVEYYKNGIKKLEENYKKGDRDGYYKSYFSNNNVKAEGWYKKGKKQGNWKYYYAYGKLQSQAFYVNDALNGPLRYYNIAAEQEYTDYYDNDVLVAMEEYDTSGRIYRSAEFPRGNGVYVRINTNGIVMFETELKNGFCQGPYIINNAKGNLMEKGFFRFGKKDDSSISYFPNHMVRLKGVYHRGNKTGVWKYYNELGQLETEETMDDGQLEGVKNVYMNNMLRYTFNYHDGYMDGKQFFYGENKEIAGVYIWHDGILVGYTYEENNKQLRPLIPVKNGTADITTYYANGKIGTRFKYSENLYTGTQTMYYSNGQIAEIRNFSNNLMLEGAYNRFYPNGKLYYTTSHSNDEDHGTEYYYDINGKPLITKNWYHGYLHGKAMIVDPNTKEAKTYIYRYAKLLSE
ncbi:MAG: hypothetical protein WCG87_02630 [Bacteroidota bacterium]